MNPSVEALHQEAVALAAQADMARRRGDLDSHKELIGRAFERAKQAANLLADSDHEPSRSVLHQCAAALAFEAGMVDEAARLAHIALEGSPPNAIAEELRGFLRNTRVETPPYQGREEMRDEEIVRLMRHNNPSGLQALQRSYSGWVKQRLRQKLGPRLDDHALEEALNDALLIVQRNAARIEADSGSLRGYFLEVAKNEFFRVAKRQQQGPQILSDLPETPAGDAASAAPSQVAASVRSILKGLTSTEQAILELDVGSNFSLSAKEVAAQLGIATNSVYTLRSRVKKLLEPLVSQ